MNTQRLIALSLTLLLSAPALAGDRVLLDLDCHDRVRPGLQQFAADAGIANPTHAYRARAKAWTEAVRACHRGYDRVRVVQAADRREPELRLARR